MFLRNKKKGSVFILQANISFLPSQATFKKEMAVGVEEGVEEGVGEGVGDLDS